MIRDRGEARTTANCPAFLRQTLALSGQMLFLGLVGLARRAKAKWIPVTAFSLRHSFALKFLEKNPGKLIELAVLPEHKSLDTTAVYLRPSQEEMTAGAELSRLNLAE